MREQASRFIGSIPENYDRFLGPRLFDHYAADLAARVARLQPLAVLELAAGTGIVTRKLRDSLPGHCQLTATDLNPPMLELAASKFRRDEAVGFEPADATQLPYQDAQFDAVVCQFGVMFFPDKPRSYREALRVLRPGGRYVFSVWGPWANNPFAETVHGSVAGFFPEDPPQFYRVPFGYHDPDAISETLAAAGFAAVTTETLSITSEIPSAEDFARGLVFGNPLHEEIVSRGGDPEAVCAAVAVAIKTGLGDRMTLHALVITAEKA